MGTNANRSGGRALGRRTAVGVGAVLSLVLLTGADPNFKFSDEDSEEAAEEAARRQAIEERLSTECRRSLKNKRIMLLIGERRERYGWVHRYTDAPDALFREIDARLERLGLNTLTARQIEAQIAEAEIEAYLNNDQDAALEASRRLGAAFVLTGVLYAQTAVNPVVGINEVSVDMTFDLRDASGRRISDVAAHASSLSGTDDRSVALSLVREQADDIVSRLYADFCSQ